MSDAPDLNLVTKSIVWTCSQAYRYPSISASIGISFASAYLLNRSAETAALIGMLTFTLSQIVKFKIVSKNTSKEDKDKLTQSELTTFQLIRELQEITRNIAQIFSREHFSASSIDRTCLYESSEGVVRQSFSNVITPVFSAEPFQGIERPAPTIGYHTLFDGPHTKHLSQHMSGAQIHYLNAYVQQEIMQDEDYIESAKKEGLSRKVALTVFPQISNVSGFTIYYEGNEYNLQLTDNLRKKIRLVLGVK